VNWDFLLYVMKIMGFGEKWIGWIRHYISSTSFAVLINGSFRLLEVFAKETLYPPLLFLLVMEVFTRMIDAASSAGLISAFKVG